MLTHAVCLLVLLMVVSTVQWLTISCGVALLFHIANLSRPLAVTATCGEERAEALCPWCETPVANDPHRDIPEYTHHEQCIDEILRLLDEEDDNPLWS